MGKETWARKLGKENIPGPAEYTTRTEPGTDSPRYTIKKLYPDPERKLDVPYNDIPTTVGRDAPKYTIRPHTALPEGNDNPGPSYIPHPLGYDYLKRKNGTMRQRNFSIERRSPRYESYSQSPFGPAKYDSTYHPGKHKDPSYTIGEHCGQSWIRTNDNPSAAAYRPNLALTMPSSPRCAIHDRVADLPPPATPGPEYDVPDGLNRRPLAIRPLHKDLEPYKTPGPGKYDIPDGMGSGSPKHSIHPLCPIKPNNHGVPYLKIKREFDEASACKTISERHPDIKGFDTPGPGEYQIPSVWNSNKGGRMSPRGAKGELWGSIVERWRSPGPAEYSPDHKPTMRNDPAYSLGDNLPSGWQGPMIKQDVPGPGQYDDRTLNPGRYRRSPRFTIRPKCGPLESESPTKDAGYVRLTKMPYEKPAMSIHPREELDLIPQ